MARGILWLNAKLSYQVPASLIAFAIAALYYYYYMFWETHKIRGAIKCHSCTDCPSIGIFTYATECTKVEYPNDAQNFFEQHGLEGLMDGLKNIFNKATEAVVRSCYKVVTKSGNGELVYRGCSPFSPNTESCKRSGDTETCTYICEGDGCNSAPVARISAAIVISCLLVAFTFVVA